MTLNISQLWDYGNGVLSAETVADYETRDVFALTLTGRNGVGTDRVFVGAKQGDVYELSRGVGVEFGPWPQRALHRVASGTATIEEISDTYMIATLTNFEINSGEPQFSPAAPPFNGTVRFTAVTGAPK